MRKAGKSKRLLCLNAIILVICTIITVVQPTFAYAAENENSFETSSVLEDLQSAKVNGQPFDLTLYPFDENKEIQIVSFIEYCYSYRASQRKDYGLYVYIYNPKGLNIDSKSKQNKIQMASSYDKTGLPNSYTKYSLKFCNRVESGDYKHLFYKFKVVDKEVNGTTFEDRVNTNKRRYDISGIELLTYGEENATEYHVGGTYLFTGYAKGYGPDKDAESTLNCEITELETLELNVRHTNFRTGVSSLGVDHYNEVNTVYFAVPKRIFEIYGHLQKIRAEWWEYKTKMAAITSNQDFYNQLLQYTGVDVGKYNKSVPIYLYSGYSAKPSSGIGIPNSHSMYWTYNVDTSTKHSSVGTTTDVYFVDKYSTIIPYAFHAPQVDAQSIFDYLYSKPYAGDVDRTVIKDWIYNYGNNLGNGYIDCNGRDLSIDLFEDSVDEGRTMGYNDKTIDLLDTFDLNSYDSNHSWWEKLRDYGFSWPETDEDYNAVSPIYMVTANDLVGTDEQISKNLLVSAKDVSNLKAYFAQSIAEECGVVLFRFAQTDYYCAPAYTQSNDNITYTDTYVAQQTLFFDFDIIELTFNKNGVYHVIPIVSDPIDIVNDFTAPEGEFQWWKAVLSLIALALLIYILSPLFPYIAKGIVWVVSSIANGISQLSKKNKNRKK